MIVVTVFVVVVVIVVAALAVAVVVAMTSSALLALVVVALVVVAAALAEVPGVRGGVLSGNAVVPDKFTAKEFVGAAPSVVEGCPTARAVVALVSRKPAVVEAPPALVATSV